MRDQTPTAPEESANLAQLMKALEEAVEYYQDTRARKDAAGHAYTLAGNAVNNLQKRIDATVRIARNTAPDGTGWGRLPTEKV